MQKFTAKSSYLSISKFTENTLLFIVLPSLLYNPCLIVFPKGKQGWIVIARVEGEKSIILMEKGHILLMISENLLYIYLFENSNELLICGNVFNMLKLIVLSFLYGQ